MGKQKTGTKEWAETNVNIQLGCEHGCRYCYARYNAVKRFKWCTEEEWLQPLIIQSKVKRSFLKRSGVVMFPSTHDVTQRNLSECMRVLQKLLEAGNRVLLVSKPTLACIWDICESFKKYRKRLMFRFTIGSADNRILAFWEPNAPDIQDRLSCLKHAYKTGYRTSVSCEPFLDCDVNHIICLFARCKPFITDSFWIGKLRDFDRRVNMNKVTSKEKKRFVKPLKAAQSDEAIWEIYNNPQLYLEKLVKWKDSIRKIIEK